MTKYWILVCVMIVAGIISIFSTDGDWTFFIFAAMLSGCFIYGLIFDPEALDD